MRPRTRLTFAAVAAAAASYAAVRRRRWPGMEGRVALVSGGSRGLGLLLARELARRGARVVICARDADELDRAREDLERRGAEVLARPCNVAHPLQARELVRAVEERFGRLDVLINNAGVVQVGPVETMTIDDFQTAMAVHYWGPLHLILAALPGMRRRRSGRIVNIASIGGKVSVPHLLPYNASKFALVGLSEGLRAELAGTGVLVTTVCPGLMRTGSPVNALFKGRHRLEYAWFSVSDALPGLSMDADRAARRIVEACCRGKAEVILTPGARLAAAVQGLAPGWTAGLLSLVNRLLPGADGTGGAARAGWESESALTRSFVTRLNRRAARENNELGARQQWDITS